MLPTFFCALLATAWLATVLTAFCPIRAYRRRRELEEEIEIPPCPPRGQRPG